MPDLKRTIVRRGARLVLLIVLILLPSVSVLPAAAADPVFVEKDGIFVYFPEAEKALGATMLNGLPEIRSFLQKRGLPVPTPLHIILDEARDEPDVRVHVIPHLEIRIPMRAPGVLEDGYTEADPWQYFLFKGLCLQGIYAIRGGVPGYLYRAFGALISPNVIIPPWVEDGICRLLYAQYRKAETLGPLEAAVFEATPPPDLELISHHPQIWPGYHAARIFGRPFFEWLDRKYGWDKILEFLQVHGRGIVPIEIDLKAMQVFGKTGAGLWRDFQQTHARQVLSPPGLLITGYWGEPFVYWNRAGVFPGKLQVRSRGRYGVVEPGGTVWIYPGSTDTPPERPPSSRSGMSGTRDPVRWPSRAKARARCSSFSRTTAGVDSGWPINKRNTRPPALRRRRG